jgi:DNA-binding winged helix-turn-helix (wHTH) protein/TolB-like protein
MNYEFGSFRLDTNKHRLLRLDGQIVPLTPKAIETLRVLIEHRDQIVEREVLMKAIWPDVTVEEGNLNVTMSMLRKALSGDSTGEKFIETVPRQGYRFLGDVRVLENSDKVLTVEKYTKEQLTIDEQISVGTRLSVLLSSRTVRLATLVAVAIVVIGAVGYLVRSRTSQAAEPRIQSLAVIPFKAINDQNASSHKGLGLADILITRLSNLRSISVRPTAAVLKFETESLDLKSIGETLNVQAVLTGTIYHANDKIRVTTQLIRLKDQTPIWAGHFERSNKDEIQLQNEIALRVVDALALNLTGAERGALTKRYTENAEAYELYVQGRYHWNKRSYGAIIQSQQLFRQAIDSDPNFALAYVGLADSLVFGYPSVELSTSIKKAIELDPNLAEAYASLGFYQAIHHWKWKDAEESFKKSIELNPNYATAHHWYATLLGIEGRFAEARAEMQRAIDINPISHNFHTDMGQLYYFTREYDKAKEYCNRALEIFPDFPYAHHNLSLIYFQQGDYENYVRESALAAMTINVTTNNPTVSDETRAKVIQKELDLYRTKGIRAYLEQQISIAGASTEAMKDTGTNLGFVFIYTFLDEKEKALQNLERAYESRAFMLPWIKVDPRIDKLRSDLRYKAVLERMNLPPDA